MKKHHRDERMAAKAFLILKAEAFSNEEAGRALGVPWQTLYRWRQKHLGRDREEAERQAGIPPKRTQATKEGK